MNLEFYKANVPLIRSANTFYHNIIILCLQIQMQLFRVDIPHINIVLLIVNIKQ